MSTFFLALFLGWLLGLATPPFYKWIVKKVTKSEAAGMLLLMFVMTACGTTTGNPNEDTITLGQAWSHVASFGSYWFWLILSAVPLIAYIAYLIIGKDSELSLPILFVCLALFAAGLLYAPVECAANTTVEQASRGVYIW